MKGFLLEFLECKIFKLGFVGIFPFYLLALTVKLVV